MIQGGRGLPSRVVFHGQPGIGKTSLASYAPNLLSLLSPGETGLHVLIDNGLLPSVSNLEISNWNELTGIIDELTTTKHDYKTLVFDVLNGFERMANAHVCNTDYHGDRSEKGFMGYMRGYQTTAMGIWKELLAALDRLREVKQMGILLLAHTAVANFRNPSGPDYDRFVPAFEGIKYTWPPTLEWADIVLFGYREIATVEKKGDGKAKGRGGTQRMIATEYSAIADAKNRHNLPPTISMGNSGKEAWDNFMAALAEGRKQTKETGNAT